MKSLQNTKMLNARYFVVLAAFLSSLLTGCATMEGAGEDIESAGEEISETADDASN
ncbi:entericidin A/B family lipoprotein [Salinimonas marina]|uniref:Entericidin A/B family lipoprotein n=1 Tax=Salinimonas marina TaxID=2785918 RepID=A0A7S9HEK9_9ALTE|nr:entericidin A/B family lipoprotein [Salinimonas marina]QPG06781.1 entericidin A/B family lipoprotein [Salinimonas marina]